MIISKKMQHTILAIIIIMLAQNISIGQNLINNPSFDIYHNYYDENRNMVYHPTHWYYVDAHLNHPIYFSTDRYLNKSFKWNLHPDSGLINKGYIANYISVLLLPKVHRAYTSLEESLEKGEKHNLSIDIKAFNQSNYFVDLLVGFKDILENDNYVNQLRLAIPDSLCNEFLYDNWISLSTDFIASGKEKIIVISSGTVNEYLGMINSNKEKFLIKKYQGRPKTKYLIDNISLTKIENRQDNNFLEEFDSLNVDEKIILRNIRFDFDKYELLKSSSPILDKVYTYLNNNKSVKVHISGHTDNFGSESYNNTLSFNRAMAVKNYLLNKGISTDRISIEGCGEEFPIDSNTNSEGRNNNRRIEMKILQKEYP